MGFFRNKIVTPLLRISMENSRRGRVKVVGIPGGGEVMLGWKVSEFDPTLEGFGEASSIQMNCFH